MAFINFGDILRSVGINKDWGISELLGGNTQSLARSDQLGGSNVQGPLLPYDYTRTSSTIYGTDSDFANTSSFPDYSQITATGSEPKSINDFKSGNSTRIVDSFDVDGAKISVTDTGEVLGLSDLKETAGYLAFKDKYGGTGGDYLEYLQSGKAAEDAAIDQYYDQGQDFLDKLEQSLLGTKGDFLNTFTAPYEAQIPLINQAYDQGRGVIDQAQVDARQEEGSALDAARRLFNELNQRNQSMFGGVSSLGQAASELLGRSQQEQFGNIRQTTANTVQGLVQKGIDLQNEVNAKLQSLELQKDQALSQAKLAFQEKLDGINSQRFQLEQDKAAAKLEALQAFNANVQNIRNQYMSFGQQLEAMKMEADLNLRNALATANSYSQGVAGDASGMLNSMLGQQATGQQNMANAGNIRSSSGGWGNIMDLIRRIGSGGRDDDENTGGVSSF